MKKMSKADGQALHTITGISLMMAFLSDMPSGTRAQLSPTMKQAVDAAGELEFPTEAIHEELQNRGLLNSVGRITKEGRELVFKYLNTRFQDIKNATPQELCGAKGALTLPPQKLFSLVVESLREMRRVYEEEPKLYLNPKMLEMLEDELDDLGKFLDTQQAKTEKILAPTYLNTKNVEQLAEEATAIVDAEATVDLASNG
jgi:hypothetical protein